MNVYAQTAVQSSGLVKQRSLRHWLNEHYRLLNACTLCLVGVLCLSYILQVTSTVAKGYELRDLEVQIQELSLQNELMVVEARKAQSLEHVSKSVKMLGFVEAEQPTYLNAGEPSYALAD